MAGPLLLFACCDRLLIEGLGGRGLGLRRLTAVGGGKGEGPFGVCRVMRGPLAGLKGVRRGNVGGCRG